MKGGESMQRVRRAIRDLVVLITIASALRLLGCSDSVQQANINDVNNQSFTFASGAVFNPALANVSTTLAFFNNATNFVLSSTNDTATGTNVFGSCTLTVTTSTYVSGTGPQVADVIQLPTCNFDIPNETLVVGNGTTTATSFPAVVTGPILEPATPSDVNNQSFTFASGAVFEAGLANVPTTLAFSNNAINFTLSSAGGRATGINAFGSCILTVLASTYTSGNEPQVNDVIRLTTCTFQIPNKTLIVGNSTTTVTSSPAVATGG
jgi:hypothetical protein